MSAWITWVCPCGHSVTVRGHAVSVEHTPCPKPVRGHTGRLTASEDHQ